MSADRINDGGPAFPTEREVISQVTGNRYKDTFPGMTLRDYFAACELKRMGYAKCMVNDVPVAYDRLAQHCYRMADAMLKARGGAA